MPVNCQELHVFLVPNWGVVRIVSTREPRSFCIHSLTWVCYLNCRGSPCPRGLHVQNNEPGHCGISGDNRLCLKTTASAWKRSTSRSGSRGPGGLRARGGSRVVWLKRGQGPSFLSSFVGVATQHSTASRRCAASRCAASRCVARRCTASQHRAALCPFDCHEAPSKPHSTQRKKEHARRA